MGQDKYAAPTVVQAHRVERTTQTKDHIAPALTSRRTVIELAKKTAEFGLLRMQLLDAGASKPVEDAELLFAQPFVYDERLVLSERKSARLAVSTCQWTAPANTVKSSQRRGEHFPAEMRTIGQARRIGAPRARSGARPHRGSRSQYGRARPHARHPARHCPRFPRDGRPIASLANAAACRAYTTPHAGGPYPNCSLWAIGQRGCCSGRWRRRSF